MKISLIIPVYGEYGYFKKLIRSIDKNYNFKLGEIIVVDDCFSEKTTKKIAKLLNKREGITLIKNQKNIGYLQTCNNAINFVSGDIVVLLNSDTEIPSNFCEKIIKCFESDNRIITASPFSSASAKYFIPQIFPLERMNKILNSDTPLYPDVSNSEGFCFCVRRSYIEKYGLFDTAYGLGYCEEVDFCYGVRSKGLRCVLIDNLYVKHKRHASFKQKRNSLLAQNNKILYSKWNNLINLFETNNIIVPTRDIIIRQFKKFATLIFFILKLRNQFISNRICSIKNIFRKKQKGNLNNKKVVYTAISGKYDILPIIHNYVDNDWDYICFTDNNTLLKLGNFGAWKILPLQCKDFDDTRNARWHKTHPHILFPNYEESLWVDANINILTPYVFDIIAKNNKELLVPKHYCRTCIFQELEAILALKKDETNIVEEMKEVLIKNQMPAEFGLNETNVFYRKHNHQNIIKLMEDWWFFIKNYSKRDQLSFSYVLFKHGIKVEDISINNARIDVLNYKIYTHNPPNTFTGKILSRLLP